MQEVYDLHQHTGSVFFHIGRTELNIAVVSNSTRTMYAERNTLRKETCITYDKRKMNILSWGDKCFKSGIKDNVRVDRFLEQLYQVFKKDKDNWNQDDIFLLKAVSDFMRLSMKELIEKSDDAETLHFIFAIPSEWEEEIREDLLRPLFIQANLLSKDDHKDRLLFCSEIESICYRIIDPGSGFYLKRGKNTIVCRLSPIAESEILIKLDLVSTVNSMFDFPGAVIYPKVVRSNSLSLTFDIITNCIRAFIDTKVPFDIQEEIIKIITSIRYQYSYDPFRQKETFYLMKPLIRDTSKWELDKHQEAFIESICLFDICAKISENTFNNVKDLLLNNPVKEYYLLKFYDEYSSQIQPKEILSNWSNYIVEYNRISFNAKNVTHKSCSPEKIGPRDIRKGASRYVTDVIRNCNINSKPRIIPPVQNLTFSPSIFLKSKPDSIMNIDISADSTLLSFSLLDENGFVKKNWDRDYFATDTSLRSLGSFFTFSELTTLNVKKLFITFAEEYSMSDIASLSDFKNVESYKDIEIEIGNMLCKDSHAEDRLVSTQQHIYIKTFALLYMTYMKDIIANKLSAIGDLNMNMQTGYAVTIETLLLNRLFDTEEGLKDVIYASGLIQRDEGSKKLRVIRQGKQLLPLIQESLGLKFPPKSFFVVARFYENHIQLTQNQVVTEFSLDDDQEVIIIQDKIIHIPNLYNSLCSNMWNNIVEDNSLVQLCDTHREYNEQTEIFTLKNQKEFTKKFKQYISENNIQLINDRLIVQLSVSCKCRVCLTANDIIELSFQPVLEDITSLLSASLINKEFFGKYWNISYVFQLIQFNYNTHFRDAVIKILKEITEDIFFEQGIDTPHYIIPKILDQCPQPAYLRRSFLHKEFQTGALKHVYSDNYGFGVFRIYSDIDFAYKSNRSDTEIISVSKDTVFLLFKKGDKIDDCQTNRIFYLNAKGLPNNESLHIRYFKLKTLDGLKPDGTISSENISEKISGPCLYGTKNKFKAAQDIPVVVSIVYEADVSSLSFTSKVFGEETDNDSTKYLPGPMTLKYF